MRKRFLSLLLALCLVCQLVPVTAEVDLDALMTDIETMAELEKAIEVSPVTYEISSDLQSIYINRPEVSGADEYTIAYNLYDNDSNPVNYFYSMDERVAVSPGYGGLFNVFVAVTDSITGAQNIQDIGWHNMSWPYADELTVGEPGYEISADKQSIFLTRPAVSCRGGAVTIAYNIYDSSSEPVNYFYSTLGHVAATPGYGGLFNVFVVVTDTVTGEEKTLNIGWQKLNWPYADALTVGKVAYEISSDNRSIYLTRPDIACKGGDVTIAYNIYDASGNPVNYFYSSSTRVAATPGYDGKFNVFITVTDTITGETSTQDIGWVTLGSGVTMGTLEVNEKDHVAGESADLTFKVPVEIATAGVPSLVDAGTGEQLAVMNDNGENGDETAGDGVFTCVYSALKMEGCRAVYAASCSGVSSNTVDVYFYEVPTPEKGETVRTIINEAAAVGDAFPQGQEQEALNAVAAYAAEKVASGDLMYYEQTEDSVAMKSVYGLTSIYMPRQEYVSSSAGRNVYTMQPCREALCSWNTAYMNYPVDAADKIANTFGNYIYPAANRLDDGEVTLSALRSIGPNSVVLWDSHGGYRSGVGPTLITGEDFDWGAWWFNLSYFYDCVTDRIGESGGKTWFSGAYVDKYCGNMNGAFIYLSACKSGYDSRLANSFLNKGAAAVVANTETIYTLYTELMQRDVVMTMCELNPETMNYYTLSEALEKAKATNGADDQVWDSRNTHYNSKTKSATPKIFGGTTARDFRFGNFESTGNLDGTVLMAADRATAISNANVALYYNGDASRRLTTDENGHYHLSDIPAVNYLVTVTADGYLPFTGGVTVPANGTAYLPTFLMVDGEPDDRGTASGRVVNALTGAGIEGAELSVRRNWDDPNGELVQMGVSGENGEYSFDLPIGNYTVSASMDGFVNASAGIIVRRDTDTGNQNISLTPGMDAGEYRIVLSWDENPRDLDSHVRGTRSNGSTFHVYYSDMNAYDGEVRVCSLDVDDTTSYGPETITLIPTTTHPYYYYIYHYAGSGSICSTSRANVKLYNGSLLLGSFDAPTTLGDGRYWNVFAIVNGQIIVRNTITSSEEVDYAGDSLTGVSLSATSMVVKNGAEATLTATATNGAGISWSSNNEAVATVSDDGTITGVYPGNAVITATATDGSGATASCEVKVQANYRALLISTSTFNPDSVSGDDSEQLHFRNSVAKMADMLSFVHGPDGGSYDVRTPDNQSNQQIHDWIDSFLGQARDGDVSMFMIASHGISSSNTNRSAGGVATYYDTILYLPVLAGWLSNVNGKVIVIISSCGAGAAVTRFDSSEIAAADIDDFDKEVVSAFRAEDPGLKIWEHLGSKDGTVPKTNEFLTDKFVILASTEHRGSAWNNGKVQYFVKYFAAGVGTWGSMPADADGDGILTTGEIHSYLVTELGKIPHTVDEQTVYQRPVIYPDDGSYALFIR